MLDAKGEPVANVAVNLDREGDGEEADEFLHNNAVANAIGTGAKTDEQGRFQLKPLPPGTYRAKVSEYVRDQSVRENGRRAERERRSRAGVRSEEGGVADCADVWHGVVDRVTAPHAVFAKEKGNRTFFRARYVGWASCSWVVA
ncbi:MAG: carboxypeptidase-like regulatory domain-containing protein [Pirellulaceae bacterium]